MTDEARRQSGLGALLGHLEPPKWLAILAFVGPMAAGMSLAAFLPNMYRSTATVLVIASRSRGLRAIDGHQRARDPAATRSARKS